MRACPSLWGCGMCASPSGCPDQHDCWTKMLMEGGIEHAHLEHGVTVKSYFPRRIMESRKFSPRRDRRMPEGCVVLRRENSWTSFGQSYIEKAHLLGPVAVIAPESVSPAKLCARREEGYPPCVKQCDDCHGEESDGKYGMGCS